MTRQDPQDKAHFERLLAEIAPRANALLLTIFGDSVIAMGGEIWLKDLIELAGQFSLTDRLVRTGVYRLSQENWIVSRQDGRRAHYSITPEGRERFLEYEARIYAAGPRQWDGRWRLVQLPAHIRAPRRTALKRELQRLGFGAIAHGLLAHPDFGKRALRRILMQHRAEQDVLAFEARLEEFAGANAIRDVAAQVWALSDLNHAYEQFLAQFGALDGILSKKPVEPGPAFGLRILLIHRYRLLLMKDPQLPDALLPADWAGDAARALCRRLYRALSDPAFRHLSAVMATAGDDSAPASFYRSRFGGLPRASFQSGLMPAADR